MSLESFQDVPTERIPALLAQLAAAQSVLAARLLGNGNATPPSQPTEAGKLLDADAAAERMQMSKNWLYKNAAKLPFAVRVGSRSLRFSETGLEKWMRSRAGR